MRFPYHQIEEDSIETVGNIQTRRASNEEMAENDGTFSPSKPLLPYWPFWCGCCQIAIGFLSACFGAVQAFVIPFVISVYAEIGLYRLNSYGAAIWSGLVLVVSGSCAVRASKIRDLTSVIQFYVTTFFSFLTCLAMVILMMWCYVEIPVIDSSLCNEMYHFPKEDCVDILYKIHKYSVISLLSAVCSLVGCLLLFLSTTNYFCPVMFGEIHLFKKLGVCWLPCFFYLPPKDVLKPYKQEQNVKV
ncbi:uncharacterized protein LOC123540235 isoform X2 [Mercenaria mercenaria]|uniref:uncharacterized protein LOC123540235 isoform X2 n=1 Tax=Mercenaria mercenaria TaxID=6596 RepID=UPI00234FA919|nr:uncharacterized protein LOC123540235 isoform X2 [Mercenaria mercenaria]XP_045181012.2 uncharacterized protein LOC123540235 isoform X2 [Mercenaria mercenaria]